MLTLAAPTLRHFCTLEVEVSPPRLFGTGRFAERRMIPILGGRVTGPEIEGTILPGGADWQDVGTDGLAELTAHYAFETDDGALVEIHNSGFRHAPPEVLKRMAAGEKVDPSLYYMRTTATLQTSDARYAHINRLMFVGTGARNASGVQIDLYAVG